MKLQTILLLLATAVDAARMIITYPLSEDGSCPGTGDEIRVSTLCFRVRNDSDVTILDSDGAISVDPDSEVHIEAPKSWGLDRVDQENLPLDGKRLQTSFDGTGVSIYIVDTGVFPEHRDFTGRARQIKSFIPDEPNEDLHGHGTHCAGTAAGREYGIARNAKVYGIKCLDKGGSGSITGVIQAVAHAVKHASKPSVISMSLGGGKNKALNNAVRDASKAGHVVVVAAGNSNSDACNYSPASAGGSGNVLSVMSTTDKDRRSGFSNYGACTDIAAPGSSITSAWIGGREKTRTISGTSMATPHVTGTVALLLQKHDFDKRAALQELFVIAGKRKISNIPSGPNLLLRLPSDGEPVTPPPTEYTPPKRIMVCHKYKSGRCFDVAHSIFGAPEVHLYKRDAFESDLYLDPTSGCGIADRDPNMKGKIVLVKRGGCLFFNKVKKGERNGALAVLIVQYKNQAPFPPAYYGSDTTALHSAMVSYDILKQVGHPYRFGDLVVGSTGAPTMRPTRAPTTLPTMEYICPKN